MILGGWFFLLLGLLGLPRLFFLLGLLEVDPRDCFFLTLAASFFIYSCFDTYSLTLRISPISLSLAAFLIYFSTFYSTLNSSSISLVKNSTTRYWRIFLPIYGVLFRLILVSIFRKSIMNICLVLTLWRLECGDYLVESRPICCRRPLG